jgi:hypothetical protein
VHVLDAATPVEPRAGDVLVAPAAGAQAHPGAWRRHDVVLVRLPQLP